MLGTILSPAPAFGTRMSAVPLLLAASLLAQEAPGTGTFTTAAVAADHPAAAEAGAEMLRAGGNAVDAAAATSLALSVVRPYSCGLGGGGFLVYYDAAAGRAHALDYREHAPAAATRDMFLSDPASSRTGGKAVAVPGTVAGLCFAQQRWGTLSRAEVFAPAVRLARSGVPLDEHDRGIRTRFVEQFAADPALRRRFPAFWTGYLFDGNLPPIDANPGPSPQADLLAAIAEEGPDAFYRGPAAAARLVEAVRDAGGVMTAADLAGYEPRLVEPLTGDVGGLTLHVMPPPSSGGVATLEILNILAARERTHGPLAFGSPRYEHVLTEALKHAFADRAEFLGDPRAAAAAGAPLPVARLTSPAYAEALAATIDPDRTFPPAALRRGAAGDRRRDESPLRDRRRRQRGRLHGDDQHGVRQPRGRAGNGRDPEQRDGRLRRRAGGAQRVRADPVRGERGRGGPHAAVEHVAHDRGAGRPGGVRGGSQRGAADHHRDGAGVAEPDPRRAAGRGRRRRPPPAPPMAAGPGGGRSELPRPPPAPPSRRRGTS